VPKVLLLLELPRIELVPLDPKLLRLEPKLLPRVDPERDEPLEPVTASVPRRLEELREREARLLAERRRPPRPPAMPAKPSAGPPGTITRSPGLRQRARSFMRRTSSSPSWGRSPRDERPSSSAMRRSTFARQAVLHGSEPSGADAPSVPAQASASATRSVRRWGLRMDRG
jgi:hypothetical protein